MDNSQNYSLIDRDCIPQRDTEADYSEWFEDAASEADWIDNISLNDVDSSTVCSLVESDRGSEVRSMTLMDELYEKNKILDREWREAEQKYQNLQVEHQKLSIQLTNERHRANKYQKKLQYIQDNHEVFSRLKQAYLNMKYNESTGRPMVEIRERACQTGLLCESCVQNAEMKSNTGLLPVENRNMVTIKKDDLSRLQQSVQVLKNKIDEREQSWSYNAERENKYKTTISELKNNIQVLKDVVASKRQAESILPVQSADSVPEIVQKENGFLKKIIVKLEKRHRDMEKLYKPVGRQMPLLNEQEKNIVHQLIRKYASKLSQKGRRSLSCDASCSLPASPRLVLSNQLMGRVPRLESNIRQVSKMGLGNGEGLIFNIQQTLRLEGDDNRLEEAEKPLTPRRSK